MGGGREPQDRLAEFGGAGLDGRSKALTGQRLSVLARGHIRVQVADREHPGVQPRYRHADRTRNLARRASH